MGVVIQLLALCGGPDHMGLVQKLYDTGLGQRNSTSGCQGTTQQQPGKGRCGESKAKAALRYHSYWPCVAV